MKVWGIAGFWDRVVGTNGRNQVRLVVAAKSQKQAAELMKISIHHFREYASETGNRMEVTAAMSNPGQVFWRTLDAWEEPLKPVPASTQGRK